MERTWRVIGVMSGSSLDGVDLACCSLALEGGRWTYQIGEARTIPYPEQLATRLFRAAEASGLELARLHRDVGDHIGKACRELKGGFSAQFIASHGHTVFHQPGEGLTLQIGCGARIAALSGSPVVCDLRTKDIAFGGQGAPLVPLGERLLFPEHTVFLNLGGISNIAVHDADRVVGYDIGPCNQVLDHLARKTGIPFDRDSAIARAGQVDAGLLARLDALDFYRQTPPRSLGREWSDAHVIPLIDHTDLSLQDRMRTCVEHIASRISERLIAHRAEHVLVTGGGAHNGLLIERLRALSKLDVVVPDATLVDFKEALIFALLGVLRWTEQPTALASVTGATHDSIGGAVYLPN
jgi:anhydro-N-acetylmuramic acid kinase